MNTAAVGHRKPPPPGPCTQHTTHGTASGVDETSTLPDREHLDITFAVELVMPYQHGVGSLAEAERCVLPLARSSCFLREKDGFQLFGMAFFLYWYLSAGALLR